MDDIMVCRNCKHFRLHYIKRGKAYSALRYGHCVYPRLKKREANTPARKHYAERREIAHPT